MERWWEIEIRGQWRGRQKEIKAVLQDDRMTSAIRRAIRDEFDLPSLDWIDYDMTTVRGKQGHFVMFTMETEGNFVTEHRDYREMATEITDPARIALMDGAPELPLVFEGDERRGG